MTLTNALVDFGLGFGFISIWLGFACLFVAVVWHSLSLQRFKENKSLPLGEKVKRHNDHLLSGLNSRLGRFGQLLLAIGTLVVIITGLIWFWSQVAGT